MKVRLIGSGSSGNATLVRFGRRAVLMDAGLPPKRLEAACRDEGVEPSTLDAILISHEHSDHAAGAVAFSRRNAVPVFCSEPVAERLGRRRRRVHGCETLPSSLDLGDLRIVSFPVPHDSPNIGFRFEGAGVRVGFVSDLGHATDTIVGMLRDCDALFVESNYDPDLLRRGPYPLWLKGRIGSSVGHLANGEAAGLIASAVGPSTRLVVLVHLSETNNRPDLAAASAAGALRRAGRPGVTLEIAGRAGVARPIDLTMPIAGPTIDGPLFRNA